MAQRLLDRPAICACQSPASVRVTGCLGGAVLYEVSRCEECDRRRTPIEERATRHDPSLVIWHTPIRGV